MRTSYVHVLSDLPRILLDHNDTSFVDYGGRDVLALALSSRSTLLPSRAHVHVVLSRRARAATTIASIGRPSEAYAQLRGALCLYLRFARKVHGFASARSAIHIRYSYSHCHQSVVAFVWSQCRWVAYSSSVQLLVLCAYRDTTGFFPSPSRSALAITGT